jgi:hypothetical protein
MVRAFKDGGRDSGNVGWLQVVNRKKKLKFDPLFSCPSARGNEGVVVIHKVES